MVVYGTYTTGFWAYLSRVVLIFQRFIVIILLSFARL